MAIESPCADICKFDRKADLCVGCFRTTDEIRQWRKFTDHKRRQILAERRRREAKLAVRRMPHITASANGQHLTVPDRSCQARDGGNAS